MEVRFSPQCLNACSASHSAPGLVWSTVKRRKVREELDEGEDRAERTKKRVVLSKGVSTGHGDGPFVSWMLSASTPV
jgi:hypothetical protein